MISHCIQYSGLKLGYQSRRRSFEGQGRLYAESSLPVESDKGQMETGWLGMYQAFKLLEKGLPITNTTHKVDIKLLDLLKGELVSTPTTHPGFHCDSNIPS